MMKGFILMGPGRSGSTLVGQILGMHHELQFVSNYNDKFPWIPYPKIFDRLYYNSKLRGFRFCPKPAEAYGFWEYYFPGFRSAKIMADGGDVLKFQNFLKTHFNSNKIFFTKITGFTRAEVFKTVFSELRVVWLHRDPLKVVLSMLNQKWGGKTKSDHEYLRDIEFFANFWCDRLRAYYEDLYKSFDRESYVFLKFEDYLKNPKVELKKILTFIGVEDVDYFSTFQSNELTPIVNKRIDRDWKIPPEVVDMISEKLDGLRHEQGF